MSPKPGDELRDAAAELLEARFGRREIEKRVSGKKVDIFFQMAAFGKARKLYVEAKDYAKALTRSDVVKIWADYSGIVERNQPASLLIVTRNGISTDAMTYVQEEQAHLLHQTIAEIENDSLGIERYVEAQRELFDQDGLSSYYIDAEARAVRYESEQKRIVQDERIDIFERIQSWISSSEKSPIAILAGYGAGKSSLAKRVVAYQSEKAKSDTTERRPILVRLGGLTRYSSIEGLLGGMFTSEFPINNFNFHVFSKLNKAGRLLIVLDGFDEMKHAMSWSDFKNQIRDLNRLSSGNSKLLLLGRPTAFLSFDEHLMVLRGVQRFGSQFRQTVDWPEFLEFELSEFEPEQTREFIERYLNYRLGVHSKADEHAISDRVEEVQEIAAVDSELFSKPVHLKILVDLASDTSIDLSRFSSGVTRWDLYEVFFSDLSERESDKDARQPIDSENRLLFLRDLAFWLWLRKEGQVSFKIEDVPDEIFHLPDEVGYSPEILKRELLTGAFLEKKDGDSYFFGHRSFAEFLVADYMISNQPTGAIYARYSGLCKDGVAQFLTDYKNTDVFLNWAQNLEAASGRINLEFLAFLQLRIGAGVDIRKFLPKASPVRALYDVFVPDVAGLFSGDNGRIDDSFFERLDEALKSCPGEIFPQLVEFRISLDGELPPPEELDRACRYAALLLERLFASARIDAAAGKTFVPESSEDDRELAIQSLRGPSILAEDSYLQFYWEPILDFHRKREVSGPGLVVASREIGSGYSVAIEQRLHWSKVLEQIDQDVRAKVIDHFRMSESLEDVVAA